MRPSIYFSPNQQQMQHQIIHHIILQFMEGFLKLVIRTACLPKCASLCPACPLSCLSAVCCPWINIDDGLCYRIMSHLDHEPLSAFFPVVFPELVAVAEPIESASLECHDRPFVKQLVQAALDLPTLIDSQPPPPGRNGLAEAHLDDHAQGGLDVAMLADEFLLCFLQKVHGIGILLELQVVRQQNYKMDDSSKVLDQSYMNLKEDNSPDKKKHNKVILPKLKTEEAEENVTNSSPGKLKRLKRKVLPGYEIATLDATMEFLDTQSYRKKVVGADGEAEYVPFGVCDDLEETKEFGLGIYLYLELIKRLMLTFIFLSILVGAELVFNYSGTGLSAYTASFTLTLAKFTLGNLSNADRTTYLIITIFDILTMVALFAFYVHWRLFLNSVIEESERNHDIVNPTLYAVSVSGFSKDTPNLEDNLKAYFDGLYRGAHEVEVVYDYNRNFKKFVSYDEAIEAVEKEKQILKQTEKDGEDLKEYEAELEKIEDEIEAISEEFEPLYAIVHFRNLKAKYSFINMCKKYALVNKLSYKLRRCLCCMPQQPERQRFLGKEEILIESTDLARPEEYNWPNMDISLCSKIVRVILSVLLLIVVIAITSSLIVFCTLYVSTTSSCANYDANTSLTQALAGDSQTLFCYCNANFHLIYVDSSIQNACTNIERDILVSNLLQVGASLVSAITNVILIVIVALIAEYLLKPATKPGEYSFIFVGVLISNYINSTLLPLILNGNIFGFKSVTYLQWVSFIDLNRLSIFSDFDRDWFAIISPYYTNFFIIAAVLPPIQLLVFCLKRSLLVWWVERKCENQDPHKITIQKEANSTITGFPFDYPAEQALITLQLFMCFMYSSLIPLLVPIFTFGLFLSFFCKKYILFHYSVRLPANENLAIKVMNLLPFIILVHGLMGVWSHTTTGIFASSSFILTLNVSTSTSIFVRALTDVLMVGATAAILAWIVIDWILIGIISGCRDCCKDDLELPVSLAAVENTNFVERIRKTNILGSYKVANNPTYGHAVKAYKELLRLKKLEGQGKVEDA